MKRFLGTVISSVFISAGCTSNDSADGELVRAGTWRAVLTVPGGELPFTLELAPRDGETRAYLINGPERVEVDEVILDKDSLRLHLTAFDSMIRARHRNGRLEGFLELIKRGGVAQTIPFSAEHGKEYRFFPETTDPPIDVSGRWDVTFVDDDGEASRAIGEFRQDGALLYGTFRTPTGDHRYLAGQVKNQTMYLSCFDGGHAFLFSARLDEAGTLEGHFWSGMAWHERWTGRRNDEVTLPDADSLTFLKPGYDRFHFEFPRVDGTKVSLSDKRFTGRVVIVVLAGSWCPNCHDETAFLARYYDRNRARGLEIVSLMYEHYRDFDRAARQVDRFRQRYAIKYDLLVAGYSDKREAAKTLPMLNHVLAYPTTIFIDKMGNVRRIHTGFSGPATREHFERYKKEFGEWVDRLLAE